jgi:hypothetical protein
MSNEHNNIASRYVQIEDQFVADLREDFLSGMPEAGIESQLREAFQKDRGGKGIHPDDFSRLMKRIKTGEV